LRSQPMSLKVTATDQAGHVRVQRIMLMVYPSNVAPAATQILSDVVVLNQKYVIDLAQYFSDPNGDIIQFSIKGLPQQSGFAFSPSGTLSGVPSPADLDSPQPMKLTITTVDNKAGVAEADYVLTVVGKPFSSHFTYYYFSCLYLQRLPRFWGLEHGSKLRPILVSLELCTL
jgi:hypothetical protein